MAVTVRSYFSLYDKRAELSQIYKKYGGRALFIVPARLDRDSMLELLCGEEPGFGARPIIWTVGDLLSELQRAAKEYERIIDPPDHKLILRWLLSEALAAFGISLEGGGEGRGARTGLPPRRFRLCSWRKYKRPAYGGSFGGFAAFRAWRRGWGILAGIGADRALRKIHGIS